MFVRVKGKEPNRYLQIVENRREGKRTLQRVVATLGRVDELAGGGVDALLISRSRFAGRVQVLEGYRRRQPTDRGGPGLRAAVARTRPGPGVERFAAGPRLRIPGGTGGLPDGAPPALRVGIGPGRG